MKRFGDVGRVLYHRPSLDGVTRRTGPEGSGRCGASMGSAIHDGRPRAGSSAEPTSSTAATSLSGGRSTRRRMGIDDYVGGGAHGRHCPRIPTPLVAS